MGEQLQKRRRGRDIGLRGVLVEREHELGVIEQRLIEARAGTGVVLVVDAPAGRGKSRLMTVAGDLAREAGMQVIGAHGSELEREFPFGLAMQLFEPRWRAIDAHAREQLMSGPARHAAHLLGGTLPDTGRFPEEQAYAVIHGLFWLCHDLMVRADADPEPLLMLVDDAHWGDRPSMRFLAYLAERIADLPIALMVAWRSGEPGSDDAALEALRRAAGRAVLSPGSLSPAGVTTLVRARFADAEPAFCEACTRVTSGNPFLLKEVLDLFAVNGDRADASAAARVAEMPPRSVMSSVLRRLDAMGATGGLVAKAVAVLGPGAPLQRVARFTGLDTERVASAADALANINLFHAGEPLSFVHPLIAAAVHASISPFDRGRLHWRAARILLEEQAPEEQIAAHLLAAPPEGDASAVAALRAAARKALTRGAAESAMRMLRRALKELPEAARPPELIAELAQAETAAGHPDAIARLEQALTVTSDPQLRARLALAQGQTLYEQSRYGAAARALAATLQELPDGEHPLTEELDAAYIAAAFFVPELDTAARERAQRLLERPDRPLSEAHLDALAHLAMHGGLRGEKRSAVVSVAERAWSGGALLGAASIDRLAWPLISTAMLYVDDLERALTICDAALATARAEDSPATYAAASHCRAWPLYQQGRITEATADAQSGLDARPDGWHRYLPSAHAALACCHIQRRQHEQAESVLSVLDDPHAAEFSPRPSLLDARAQLRLHQGRPREALRDALAAGEELEAGLGAISPGALAWKSTAALAALALGNPERASELAAAELGLALAIDIPRVVIRNHRILALAEGGEAGVERLATAVADAEDAPLRLEYIAALVDYGGALRRANRRAAAREPLRRALDLAHRTGASALAQRAQTELAATGARSRRALLSGVDSLTPSERRVAELAAQGHTTRQVAEALFVTPKTVEFHLRNTYQKLDIKSRRQLVERLKG